MRHVCHDTRIAMILSWRYDDSKKEIHQFRLKKEKNGEHWASDDQGSVQMIYVGRFVLKEKYYILICTVDMLVEKYWKKAKRRETK
jgi:hypothetical protein